MAHINDVRAYLEGNDDIQIIGEDVSILFTSADFVVRDANKWAFVQAVDLAINPLEHLSQALSNCFVYRACDSDGEILVVLDKMPVPNTMERDVVTCMVGESVVVIGLTGGPA